jgi:hypothetical protein
LEEQITIRQGEASGTTGGTGADFSSAETDAKTELDGAVQNQK